MSLSIDGVDDFKTVCIQSERTVSERKRIKSNGLAKENIAVVVVVVVVTL